MGICEITTALCQFIHLWGGCTQVAVEKSHPIVQIIDGDEQYVELVF